MTDLSRASSLHGFAEFAISQGLNPAEMLKAAGLPTDVLEHPEGLISYRKLLGLLELCVQRSGNPFFSLQFGLHQGVGIFGPLLYLILNAKNVREALQGLARNYQRHSGAGAFALEPQGDLVMISYLPLEPDHADAHHGAELAKGIGTQLMRMLLGNRWQPVAAYVQHAPVGELSVYRRLLGLEPQFNSPFNGHVFEARLLDAPLATADGTLHDLVQRHLQSVDELSDQGTAVHTRQLVHSFLSSGRASIEVIAEYMMLNPRTLQRYLAAEGTTFQRLLDEVRQETALRYLKESNVSLSELAQFLGYSDLSAFSRAFQRWYGMSPRDWLKSLPAMEQTKRRYARLRARRAG
ncbi:AraC family transcriptional regulator [Pseudomonas jinjuensis]|uniref:AraC-type DNA-binding protein n=1 Tax=Pseudomonas jinjuensis TaxID=198616 RepID=A0A1H0D8M5_9PSED|nr:AraC family transcriptional regulator [Pseudomonas jinjuensis]SDN66554.1 AraC-type DNA-binding protein [Pseudomonas jinjuensis]